MAFEIGEAGNVWEVGKHAPMDLIVQQFSPIEKYVWKQTSSCIEIHHTHTDIYEIAFNETYEYCCDMRCIWIWIDLCEFPHTSHSIHRIEWFAQGDSEKSCNFCACKCAHLYASIIENDFINGQQRWALITVHFSQMPKCWNEAKSRRLHSIGRVNTIGLCWPKAHPQPTPFLLIKVIAIDAIDSHRCKNISTIQKLAKLSINKKSKIECR